LSGKRRMGIKTYKEFTNKLESMGLKMDDLFQYGCMSKTGLRNFKKHFSVFADSKEEWEKFKKDINGYYSIVIMGPDIALKNKKRRNE
jgi:hypothetical protein